MKMNPAIWLASLCIVVAFVLTGCGGGDNGGTDTPQARAAFISSADQICRTLTLQEQTDAAPDPATGFNNNIKYLTDAVNKLDALTPPTFLAAPFNTMMTHFHNDLSFLQKNKTFLIALTIHLQQDPRDTKARDRFEKYIKPFDHDAAIARAAAEKIPLNACAAGLGPKGGG